MILWLRKSAGLLAQKSVFFHPLESTYLKSTDTFLTTILWQKLGTAEGGRRGDRQRKSWGDNFKGWTRITAPGRRLRMTLSLSLSSHGLDDDDDDDDDGDGDDDDSESNKIVSYWWHQNSMRLFIRSAMYMGIRADPYILIPMEQRDITGSVIRIA